MPPSGRSVTATQRRAERKTRANTRHAVRPSTPIPPRMKNRKGLTEGRTLLWRCFAAFKKLKHNKKKCGFDGRVVNLPRAESRITYPFLSPFIGNRNRYREMFIVHNKQELENNTNIFLPNDRGLNSAQGVQILCHSLYQGSDEWHNLLTFKERFNSAFQIKSARKSVTLLMTYRLITLNQMSFLIVIKVVIGKLTKGQSFGEISVMKKLPATCSVVSSSPIELGRFGKC